MLLRRIAGHLKSQNWFAVLLDLVVVIVGIYIGLQADAWMTSRQEHALEREYIERLLSDMEESIEAQRDNMEEYRQGLIATDYIAELQRSGDLEGVDRERLIEGLNAVGWVPPVVTNMITIRELQATGNIALIRDVELRRAIGQFERSYATIVASAEQNRGFMSAAAPEYMRWSFLEANETGQHRIVTTDEDPSFGYTQRWDEEQMMANPAGANITSWVSGWGKYDASLRLQHHHDTVAFRDLLKRKLDD